MCLANLTSRPVWSRNVPSSFMLLKTLRPDELDLGLGLGLCIQVSPQLQRSLIIGLLYLLHEARLWMSCFSIVGFSCFPHFNLFWGSFSSSLFM